MNEKEHKSKDDEIAYHQNRIAQLRAEVAEERKTFLWSHVKDLTDDDMSELVELLRKHLWED